MVGKTLLVVYYSRRGHTDRMAQAIAEGARSAGVESICRSAEDCTMEEMASADGLAIGSPTYFSNVAWPVKKMIDESIVFYTRGQQLRGKVGGIFTASGTAADGKDCLAMLDKAFGFHHHMRLVPGIIAMEREAPDQIRQRCLTYGRQIAEAMLRNAR